MSGWEHRVYEIERRLRDLDLRVQRSDDQTAEQAQWWATFPLRGRSWLPASPSPPGRITACCSNPIPEILTVREVISGSTDIVYDVSWRNYGTTGFPASNGHWEGVRPVSSVVTKIYCTNYFGGSSYYWNLEQGGAYVGADVVACDPFHLEFHLPSTTISFEVDPA